MQEVECTCKSAPVTMVIPAYNAARYLGLALDSIESQTLLPVEVIVVDDGSRDATPHLLARRQAATRRLNMRIITQSNRGLSAARNAGIAAARTPLVGLLDADDYLYPTFIEETYAVLSDGGVFDVIFTDRDVVDLNGENRSRTLDLDHPDFRKIPCQRLPNGVWALTTSLFRFLLHGNLIPAAGVLLRRQAWAVVGGYDPELGHAEDRMFYLRLSKLPGGFVFIDKPLSAYRRHDASLTSANNHVRMALGGEQVLEKLLDNAASWGLNDSETQWVRDALRDARQETNWAIRYGADPMMWRAVSILRRRGDLDVLTAGGVLATYLARKLWYRVRGG